MRVSQSKTQDEYRRQFLHISLVVVFSFFILGLRLWYLQILNGEKWLRFAESNRIEVKRIPALRGRILDRNGKVIADNKPARPNVFMYRAAGLVECCGTFGPDNFGLMVDLAGGHNLGSDFLPGYTGSINPEQVIASNPDIIVVTGSDWTNSPDAQGFVSVGPGTSDQAADSRKVLASLVEAPAFTGSKAVADGNVHAIWHQFYTSPYQFVAIAEMAKWFHPELFADVDADATFKEFYDRFLPIPYEPGAWLSLKSDE